MEPISSKNISRVVDYMHKRQESVPKIVNFPINHLVKAAIMAKNLYDHAQEPPRKSTPKRRSSYRDEST